MLALAQMSAAWQAIFFGLSTAAFAIAFGVDYVKTKTVNLIALGLALFTFVWFYNALAGS